MDLFPVVVASFAASSASSFSGTPWWAGDGLKGYVVMFSYCYQSSYCFHSFCVQRSRFGDDGFDQQYA